MRFLSFLILLSLFGVAQNMSKNGARDTCVIRISAAFNLEYNYSKSSTSGNLSATQNLLLNNMSNNFINLNTPDLQFIFYDKIGLNTGISSFYCTSNVSNIENNYTSTEQNYYTQIANNSFESGRSPVQGDYNFTCLKIGFLGFIKSYRNLVFLPSINTLINLESRYPNFEIRYKQANSNYMFIRSFYSENEKAFGANLNLKARLYFKVNDLKRNIASVYIEGSLGFNYIKTSANTLYSDEDIYGNITKSTPVSVQKELRSFYFGASVGFELHKLKKTN